MSPEFADSAIGGSLNLERLLKDSIDGMQCKD